VAKLASVVARAKSEPSFARLDSRGRPSPHA